MASPAATRPSEDPFGPGIIAGILMIATALRLMALAAETYPLYGDEAQYWAWGQTLDWGYFSKPPLVAWLIRATTTLIGDREFGVRLASPILHGGTAYLIYLAGSRLYDRKAGFWGALIYVSLPAVTVSSMLMTTDVPLLFFWALGLACLTQALETNGWRAWIGLGVAIGLGLLSKYAMALFVLSAALYLVTARRDALANRRLWASLALGVVLYLPNLAWNWSHGLATFKHTAANADLGGSLFHLHAFFEFVASQFGVFGPVTFLVLLGLMVRPLLRPRIDDKSWFLLCFALPTLLLYFALALLSRAHANWAAPAYVSASLLVAAWLEQTKLRRSALIGTLALHALVAGVIYNYQATARLLGIELTANNDPFTRLKGGRELGRAVSDLVIQHGLPLVMTEDRMVFATLAFYVKPRPAMIEYNWKPYPGDQFEMTTDVKQAGDADILFVTTDEKSSALGHFASVEQLATITLPIHRDRVLRYYVFDVRGYKD
jgi:hypothetical protein